LITKQDSNFSFAG